MPADAQESRALRNNALQRLGNDRGDPLAALGEQGIQLRGVVPGRNQDALTGFLENTSGIRLSLGEGRSR